MAPAITSSGSPTVLKNPVVVEFDRNSDNAMGNHEVKTTNVEVCVRVRPMIVSTSGTKFFEKKHHHGGGHGSGSSSSNKRPPSGIPTSGSSRRISRLPTPPGGVKSPRKPLLPSRSTSSSSSTFPSSPNRKKTLSADSPPPSPAKAKQQQQQQQQDNSGVLAWDVIGQDTVSQTPESKPVQGRTSSYTLDNVYGPQSESSELYHGSIKNVVRSAMEGYHASVFAYGQTSTGKTYTMTGTKENPGIVPLAVRDCFQYVSTLEIPREYLLRVSYMEIYNEQIVDLLAPSTSAASSIRIFETKQEGVVIRGLREEVVSSPEQVFALIANGEARRQIGSTNMNTHSSRSHCVFRLLIESRVPTSGGGGASSSVSRPTLMETSSVSSASTIDSFAHSGTGGSVRVSSLSLVDLAGSESVRLTGSTGERRKEGQYINKSLMTLGQVVYKLSEWSSSTKSKTSSTPRHIPYRDSKLTRLLQPSLSGNAQIVIVCNISPEVAHVEESHNTLKFGMRAKRIQQKVTVTEVSDEKTLLQNYRSEIEDLRQQLKEAREAQQMLEQQPQKSTTTTIPSTTSGTSTASSSPPPPPMGSAVSVDTVDDAETKELVEAIQKMEKLILKTHKIQDKKPNTGAKKPKPEDDDDEYLLSSVLHDQLEVSEDEELDSTSTCGGNSSNGEQDNDDDIPSTPNMVDELHRIQGLLGSVLKRKGARVPVVGGANSPLRPKPPEMLFPDPSSDSSTVGTGSTMPTYRDAEVDELRAQLHIKEVATSLRKADSRFLQSQLAEKDALLAEVSQILDALEKRQLELEAENAALREKLKNTEANMIMLQRNQS